VDQREGEGLLAGPSNKEVTTTTIAFLAADESLGNSRRAERLTLMMIVQEHYQGAG